jgi:hypothetical protein
MNATDLSELPQEVRKDMAFRPVKTLEEALAIAMP